MSNLLEAGSHEDGEDMATAQMTDQDLKKKTAQNQKALDTAITQIERSYGKGSIMRMGEDSFSSSIEGSLLVQSIWMPQSA